MIQQVLDVSSPSSRAASAQVCTTWSTIALDLLWRNLNTPWPLLELISPLERDSDGEYVRLSSTENNHRLILTLLRRQIFTETTLTVDWNRFDSYARRVRSLDWDDEDTILSPTLFGHIYLSRPGLQPLLPRVVAVKWTVHHDEAALHLLPFLSSSVNDLLVSFGPYVANDSIDDLLRSLSLRVEGLKTFEIAGLIAIHGVDVALADCLKQMEVLEVVTLPQWFGTPRVVAALGSLTSLKEVLAR